MNPLSTLGGKSREPAGLAVQTGSSYPELAKPAEFEFYPLLREATIEVARDKAAEATLVFESLRQPDGTWTVQDSGVFTDWTPMRLLAVFGPLRQEELMRGYVREVKVEHPDNPGESKVTVVCQDHSLAADRKTRRRVWGGTPPTSDQQILAEVLPRYLLKPDPTNGPGAAHLTVNQDATDAAFLRGRAEDNGYDLLYAEGLVYFGPVRLDPPAQDPILVAAGPDTNCTSVNLDTDGRKPDKVVIEFVSGEGASATVREVEVTPNLALLGLTPIESSGAGLDENVEKMKAEGGEESAIRRKAQAKVNEASFKTTATGALDGTAYGHVLRVGRTVRLDGVGPTYSGPHLVDKVTHAFTADGYQQRFTLLRNAYGDDGVGALLPGAGTLASVTA